MKCLLGDSPDIEALASCLQLGQCDGSLCSQSLRCSANFRLPKELIPKELIPEMETFRSTTSRCIVQRSEGVVSLKTELLATALVYLQDSSEMCAARSVCQVFNEADSYAWADRIRIFFGLKPHSSSPSILRLHFISMLKDIAIDIPCRQEVELKRLRIWAWSSMHAPSVLHGEGELRFECLRHLICIDRLGTWHNLRSSPLNMERFCLSVFVASSLTSLVPPDMLLLCTASVIRIARALSDQMDQLGEHGLPCFTTTLQLYAEMACRCPAMWSHWTSAQDIIESFGLERTDLATVSYKEAASDLWNTMQRSMHSKSAEGAGHSHAHVPLYVRAQKLAYDAADAEELSMALQRCILGSSEGACELQ